VVTGQGQEHDLTLYRRSDLRLPKSVRMLRDLGYQGIQHDHPTVVLPIKRTKKRELSDREEEYNRGVSRERVMIEHVFAWMKRFKIIAEKYRGRREYFPLRVSLIAAIFNFERST
jgi:transposase